MQSRRDEADEIADNLAVLTKRDEHHFARCVLRQIDLILRIERDLLLVQGKLFPMHREKWLQILQ
jgi:hypothetical protein